MEAIQEFLWMFSASSRLVFIQHNGLSHIPTGAVEPHIAVVLGCLSGFVEDLECRFIRVEHLPGKQFPVQPVIYRL